MRILKVFVLLAVVLAALGNGTRAGAQQQVTLGNATVGLTGPWKFHTGDNMAWAQPGFDDSAWGALDLTPPPGSHDAIRGSSGYVPGWTARGYPGYHGYAWYRLRVNIEYGQSALALKMPDNVDDAYQIYVNGKLAGEFGRFTADGVSPFASLPEAFSLPAQVRTGPMTIAIRMWMTAFTPFVGQDTGGLHGPPVLGQAASIDGLLRLDWDAIDRSLYSLFAELAILLASLIVAFVLFGLDRKEPAYLWLGLTCAGLVAFDVLLAVVYYTTWLSASAGFLLRDAVFSPATIGAWVVFWGYWFRLDRMARLQRMTWSLVALLMVAMAMLRAPLYGGMIPVHAIVWLSPLSLALKLLLGVLLIWVTVRGIRKDREDGWLAMAPVLLVAISLYTTELLVRKIPHGFFLFGVSLDLRDLAVILSLVIITVLLVRRFFHSQREQQQLRTEVEQARHLQQVLIPEALPTLPAFTFESEYRPAQQVGGDFFQIIAHPADGSVLVVLGDVTGHGLQAAMLVSLLVGAIRTEAAHTYEPLAILSALNSRLLGRGQAQATCLALLIAPDGEVKLANAGHLAPYLNRQEMAMDGAVPLGMVEDAEFTVSEFALEPGDELTLLTDGVIEAQNDKGELFGFARTNALLQEDKSAAEIASSAQAFGQQDDITVVRIVRTTVGEASLESQNSRGRARELRPAAES